jgi:hypothetical protein
LTLNPKFTPAVRAREDARAALDHRAMQLVSCAKKTGRKINSPPGLKFGIMTPKKYSESFKALRASAFFSSHSFS